MSTKRPEVEIVAFFGGQMGDRGVVREIDKAIVAIADLRALAGDIHGKPSPWRFAEKSAREEGK